MRLSQAPLSTPIANAAGKLDTNWTMYFLKSSAHLERSTNPKRAIAIDNPNESLVYINESAKISYSYTGKGGCTFNLDGYKLVMPATEQEQTVNSFMIIAQGV